MASWVLPRTKLASRDLKGIQRRGKRITTKIVPERETGKEGEGRGRNGKARGEEEEKAILREQ